MNYQWQRWISSKQAETFKALSRGVLQMASQWHKSGLMHWALRAVTFQRPSGNCCWKQLEPGCKTKCVPLLHHNEISEIPGWATLAPGKVKIIENRIMFFTKNDLFIYFCFRYYLEYSSFLNFLNISLFRCVCHKGKACLLLIMLEWTCGCWFPKRMSEKLFRETGRNVPLFRKQCLLAVQ